jgi:uncharacterized protein YbaR (Trm112 family)
MSVEIDSTLLQILACPQCHSNLIVDYEADELVCSSLACALAYPVRDGIPVMLVDEARSTRRQGPTGPAQPAPLEPPEWSDPSDLPPPQDTAGSDQG